MTSNKTAAERIAAMRKCYGNSPEPVDHLSDLELVFRELDAAVKNECQVKDSYNRLLQGQNRWERDVRTAARRAAEDDRLAYSKAHMEARLRKAEYPLSALAYRAQQIGPRVGKEQLDGLHQCARDVADLLKQPAESEDLNVTDRRLAEIRRLRDYITAVGRALHAEIVTERPKGGCYCRGCELIRGMDDVAEEKAMAHV